MDRWELPNSTVPAELEAHVHRIAAAMVSYTLHPAANAIAARPPRGYPIQRTLKSLSPKGSAVSVCQCVCCMTMQPRHFWRLRPPPSGCRDWFTKVRCHGYVAGWHVCLL